MKKTLLSIVAIVALSFNSFSQLNEDEIGAWYMYFWNTTIKESSWGFQGDLQYRNWNLLGDLEQLLLRGGITYKPKNADIKFTLGYAHVTTGAYGDDDSTTGESRIYQEALFPQKIGSRVYLNHRWRFEERFVDDQDFRTRYRYNLFMNVALTQKEIKQNCLYLALYNEIFINGQRQIGEDRYVAIFDRNRTYVAMGYALKDNLKIQLGAMKQITNNWEKVQAQVSLHHKF